MEISLNVKTESLVELSLGRLSLPFVSVHDIPLLMNFITLSVNSNVFVFTVKFSNNFDNLSFLVDDCWSLISEELPPSW
jgi:hypothetical protein